MDQRQKRKARLRLARRVALITVCLLIGICVYSVLDPVPVSIAGSFLSRAKVWISNVLQPDATTDASLPDTDYYSVETPSEQGGYKTNEEIHTALGFTVYEPTQIIGGMKLGDVEATVVDGDLATLKYCYMADGESVVQFPIRPGGGLSQPNSQDDATIHTAPTGEFSVYKTAPDVWRAVTYTDEATISIYGNMDKDAFLKMLDTLRVVN